MANSKHLAILRQEVQVWNDWRKNNPQIEPNLRGASLRNKDLRGINFSKTDIRGTNFAKANLRGTNFQEAQAGLNRIGMFILFLYILSVSMLSFIFLLIISIGVTTHRSNLYSNISAFGDSLFGDSLLDKSIPLYNYIRNITNPLLTIFFVAIFILLGTLGTTIYPALIEVSSVSRIVYIFTSIGLLYFTPFLIKAGMIVVLIIPIFCSIIGILIWFYSINNRYEWTDKYFGWISKYSIDFVSSIGTNFMYSNLTESNFTNAVLKNSNFRKAIITHVNWYKAKDINLSKLDKTILNDKKVLNLLITRDGDNKSYINCNFQGANLSNTNLIDANLELANLNEAILENSRLNRAVLAKAQVLNTNFKQANLTGACIEDWNINKQTKFDNVICEYILLDKDKKQYSPNQGKFAPGEFTDFYHQAFKTIELIFANNLNWKEFLRSFQKEYLDIIENSNEIILTTKEQYKNQTLSTEQIEELNRQLKSNQKSIKALQMIIASLYSSSSNKSEKAGDIIIKFSQHQKIGSAMQDINQIIVGDDNSISNNDIVGGDKKNNNNIYPSPELIKIENDIQSILEELEQKYNPTKELGQKYIADEAIQEIDNKPNLVKRILNVSQEALFAYLEARLISPALSAFLAALKEWRKNK